MTMDYHYFNHTVMRVSALILDVTLWERELASLLFSDLLSSFFMTIRKDSEVQLVIK